MKKILVIQTAFIGDVILATSLLESLNVAIPDAEISILVRKGNESLFVGHPFLKEVLVWDKKEGKYRSLIGMLKVIRSHRFDHVINLHRFASSGFLTCFSKAKHTVGYDKNPWSWSFSEKYPHQIGSKGDEYFIHEIDRNFRLIENIAKADLHSPRLYPPEDALREMSIPERFITISPASVWFTKAFPEHRWVSFLNEVLEIPVYLLGGSGDLDLLNRIAKTSNHRNLSVQAGKLSLLQSAALMAEADMNFVNDSAPLHLASSMQAPVRAMFCSTIPEFGFGPTESNGEVIQMEEELECRPCGLHGRKNCPLGHFHCAEHIELKRMTKSIPL